MISEREKEMLVKQMENNLNTRNTCKTFAFTTALATLGMAFVAQVYVEPWFFLVPYCLIIPFSARIVYGRITHARVRAYLMVYAPEDMHIAIKGPNVPESNGKLSFSIIEQLNNYELFLLSLICLFAFYSKYFREITTFSAVECAMFELPILLSGIVFAITKYGKNYGQWLLKYKSEWEVLKQAEKQETTGSTHMKPIHTETEIKICDEEYTKLIELRKLYNTTRNTLLTFSFTSVLAVLGIAISTDAEKINPWICLVPFFLIIPFSARISYYRLESARLNAFLKRFVPEKMIYEMGSAAVPERHGSAYPAIAWLINHEMVLLGAATGMIFCIKLIECTSVFSALILLQMHMPLIFVAIVFWISESTYSYKELSENYNEKWDDYYKELQKKMRRK